MLETSPRNQAFRAARQIEAQHGGGLNRIGRDLLVDELMRCAGFAPFSGAAKTRQYARLKAGERALIAERARRLGPQVRARMAQTAQELRDHAARIDRAAHGSTA